MQFLEDAPGLLTKVGGSYVGRWSVSPSNYGHTQEEVASWVSSALNSPLGWRRRPGLTLATSSWDSPKSR
jgi:hypothetical protein